MMLEQGIWPKISLLKPTLREHVNFTQQYYRGQEWYVLTDVISGTHFRCPEAVYQFLKLLDGKRTIQQAFEISVQQSEYPPVEADILSVIATLQNKDLLAGGLPQSASEMYQRFEIISKKTKLQRWSRPLSIKWSIWDPDKFLAKLTAPLSFLFTKYFFFIVLAIILYGSLIASNYWQALSDHFVIRFMDAQNLLLIWLLYPLIKFLHELGHALATKHWGGEVHDMGVLFIVFIPIPYVEASSSHQFPNKYHRMFVAGAGVLVELLLAAIALFIWLNLEEGMVRDLAFNVAVIGGLSSLLVNGNPLLRFDGYYVLSDALEIPNLSTRSTQYLGYIFQKCLLGIDSLASPVRAKGERTWFLLYGIAAGIYRLIISFGIAFFVASNYLVIGVILAIWYSIQQIVLPVLNALKSLIVVAKRHSKIKRLMMSSSLFFVLFYLTFFILPIQRSFHIEGVITLPENAIVRAEVDGFLIRAIKEHGEDVNNGDTLFYLENEALRSKAQLLQSQLHELEARESQVFNHDQIQSQILKEEILQVQASLNDANKDLAKLEINSAASGFFSIERAQDMIGRFYRKGDPLAYIVNFADLKISAVIPQDTLHELFIGNAEGEQKIEVKLNSAPDKTYIGSLQRDIPQASFQLPVAELGSSAGGKIMVDNRDESGLTTLEAFYQLEIAIPDYDENYLAAKADIKIQHSGILLADYLYRQLRNMLLKTFEL